MDLTIGIYLCASMHFYLSYITHIMHSPPGLLVADAFSISDCACAAYIFIVFPLSLFVLVAMTYITVSGVYAPTSSADLIGRSEPDDWISLILRLIRETTSVIFTRSE